MMVSTHRPLADMGRSGECVYIPDSAASGQAAVYKTPDGRLLAQGGLSRYEREGRAWVGPMLTELKPGTLRLVQAGTRRYVYCEVLAVPRPEQEGSGVTLHPIIGKPFLSTLPAGSVPYTEAKYDIELPRQGEVEGRRYVLQPLQADARAWYAYPLATVGALVDIPATLVGNVLWGVGIIAYSPAIIHELSQKQADTP